MNVVTDKKAFEKAIPIHATDAKRLPKLMETLTPAERKWAQASEFDDFMLADIGVSRADVDWAAHLPLSTDATEELERRTAARQRQAALHRPGWGAY